MMLQVGDGGVVSAVNEDDLIYVDKNELDELVDRYNRLKEENEHIKTTIKTMMENERTELGRSVLRQLWEAIQ